jgi:ethanolamine ammonia-lyase large subunit
MAAATAYDPNRPISDRPHTYLDAFASYNTRLFRDKVRARFQLNLRNIQEWKTHLEAIGAFPDGSPHTFRIKEPMTAIFSTSFEL